MRSIPAGSLAKLNSAESIEPINIVAVKWGNGNPTLYSDKVIPGCTGKIIEIGTIDDAQRSDSSGSTSAVTVTLDDSDGSLKTIFNNTDIHLKPATVYQTFNELGLSGKFSVLSGQVSSPITWNEGERTITFDIVSKLEDREVGWSAEMGNFNLVAQELLGQAWPMIFGTVQHAPGLQLQNIPTAFTTQGFLLTQAGEAYDSEIDDLFAQWRQLESQKWQVNLDLLQRAGLDFQFDPHDYPEYESLAEQQIAILTEIDKLRAEKLNRLSTSAGFIRGSVPLIPTVNVTQPFNGIVRVGNNFFTATIKNTGGTLNCTPVLPPGPVVISNPSATDQYYDVGTQVVIADDYPIEFVASIVPGTVKRVWAMRSFNGLKKMAVVPPKFYTISTKNYGGQEATIVTIKKPLSTIMQQAGFVTRNWESNFGQYMAPHMVNQVDWEDQIYVTFQSSVGPNPVDIMEWLITTYTSNEFDTTSFNHVKSILANNPMNFMLQGQPNVMDVLTDIAYQARCVIYLRDDVFHLLFLPEKPDPVDTITEDDIMEKTMEITTTPTEKLVTKYEATYRPDYSPVFSQPVRVILRFNINKYGLQTESHDFSMYNTYDSVEHSAVFWMIRKSNTWKIFKAKLFITKLNLEVFDAVTLSFNHPYIANGSVVGLITSCKYNSEDSSVDVEIWTPVRLGEMKPYTFAWPAGLTKQDIFPTVREVQQGSTSGTQGGNQLPPANSEREELGRRGGVVVALNDRSNWTTGPGSLGEADFVPPDEDPYDQQWPITPIPEGAYNFANGPRETFVLPALYDPTSVFPAKLTSFVAIDEDSGMQTYKAEGYFKGLSGKSSPCSLKCLQLDPDDRIPDGTWVVGCALKYAVDATDVEGEGSVTKKYEYFFQIPIWLG